MRLSAVWIGTFTLNLVSLLDGLLIPPILVGSLRTRLPFQVVDSDEGVAQLVEQRPFKPWVLGSSPSTLIGL